MRLISVYERFEESSVVLFKLLAEREPHQNISHRAMPTWEEHVEFVLRHPYAAWYLVEVDGYPRGAVYLTKAREIGIGILKGQRGHRYGLDAVAELMRLHPGRFLWNVNPSNTQSIALAHKLGFSQQPIQFTYEKEPMC
jgi:RimJ/RimL family protein N-acetyltransferase